jgi:MFS family permease
MGESPEPPVSKRNFTLGVVNGALWGSTMRLTDPGALMSLLVLRLTGSAQMIGLMAFIGSLGWYWPALIVASMIEHRKRKLPFYQKSALVRVAAIWGSAAVLFTRMPLTAPLAVFWVVTILAFVQYSGAGVAYVPFMDVVGKTVPPRLRGLFLALRMTIGEVLGFGTAALAAYLLSERCPLGYPRTFGSVMALAAALQTVSILSFSFIKEPERPVQRRRLPFALFFRRGLRIFRRDRSFRNFTLLRFAFALGSMALPFVAAFAKEDLQVSESTVAGYLALSSVAVLLANLLWGRLGDSHGNRTVLRVYSALAVLPVIIALAAAHAPARMVTLPVLGAHDLRAVLAGAVFFLAGLAGPARAQGETNYILDLAPEQRRSTYLAFSHTTVAPLTAVPLLAGWLAERTSYATLFAVCLGFAGLTNILAATGLHEPRAVWEAREH